MPRSSKNQVVLLMMVFLGVGAGCTTRNIHNDLSDSKDVLVRQWTLPTNQVWEAGVKGTEYSNPLIVDNTLYFGSQGAGLVALYPGLVQTRWVLPIENGVMSEIAYSNGSLYLGGGDGYLYSVSKDTGKVNWRYLVRTTLLSKPTISGGRLFATTSDDTVYAFDAGSGEWLWHYKRRTTSAASIHAASSPLVDGDLVIVGLSDGYLIGLSVQDGKIKWERQIHPGKKFTDVDAHPVLHQGILYVPSYDGALYAIRRSTGEIVWRFDAGGSKQVLIEGDRLFLPSSDGKIYALRRESSQVVWTFELDDGVPTQIASTDRYLIFGSSHQYLYIVDKNTGKGVYRYNVGDGSGFRAAPVFDSGSRRVYLLSDGGNLMAFTLRKDRKKVFARGQADPYEFFYR